jgi:4'-phosphopantetheinyl transferase
MCAEDNAQATPPVRIMVWTMATAGLDEPAVAPWAAVLETEERARAARFVFPHSRIEFVAAHALTRAVLASVTGSEPAAFRFSTGPHGKPAALLGGQGAQISFNLSHTDGVVGVAVAAEPSLSLGFDLEPLGRNAPLEVARRYFTAREVAWLHGLPPAGRAEGFLRLWTLKEAFIKATGKGLTQDLSSFRFRVHPPEVAFAPGLAEQAADWRFAQRVVRGEGLAAVGVRTARRELRIAWRELDAAAFDPGRPFPVPSRNE